MRAPSWRLHRALQRSAHMTVSEIINGILDREQQGMPPYLAPHDAGGRTSWGIAERFHPEAWTQGPPTRAAAFVIYAEQYVRPFDPLISSFVDDRLRIALIDDGVLAGVGTAIQRFQRVLGVEADGVLGPLTIRAAHARPPANLLRSCVVARAIDTARGVQQRPADLAHLPGWLTRILGFLP